MRPDGTGCAAIEKMRTYALQEGRDPDTIGIEGWVSIANGSMDDWVREVGKWKDIGATHISVNTMNAGLSSPDGHIDAIRRFKEALGDI